MVTLTENVIESGTVRLNVTIELGQVTLAFLNTLTPSGMAAKIDAILQNTVKIMASLDQVLQDVTDETTAIASVSALIQGLLDQIKNAGLSAADQAKVDAIFAGAEANKAALATALAANVPPAP